jgi:Leucine-rich repeat (LRR) protein
MPPFWIMHFSDSKSLSKLGKLKQLNLSQNSLNKEIIRYLAALPVLNSLDLNRNRIDGRLENAGMCALKN